jgi:hypothetical protein
MIKWAAYWAIGMMTFATALHAQRAQDWILLGDKALEANDPYGALRYFEKAMELDSAKALHNYKYAEALRYNHNYEKAAFYYYKVYRRDRGKVYPEGPAWLATMQKQSGEFEEAKKTWRRVRDQHRKDEDGYWFQKANQEMRAADLAMVWEEEKPNYDLEALPESINSEMSEFGGVFLPDGKLVFASLRGNFDQEGRLQDEPLEYRVRIYVADSAMLEVDQIEYLENMDRPEANFTKSESSNRMAFVAIGKGGQNEIYVAVDYPNTIDITKILPQPEDSAYYSHPAFGVLNGEEVLFFSSDREGGFGKTDIWFVPLNDLKAPPINAGALVNSPGAEVTPFFRNDEKQLYFASDWHHGMGGFDLFRSEFNGEAFGFPENLKPPFNTAANDLYYSFNSQLGKGTVTSNRPSSIHPENEGCCNDLWLFTEVKTRTADTLPEITTLEELNQYLPVKLFFHNDEPDPRTTKESTNRNYLETYRAYAALIPVYEQEYNKGLDAEKGEKAEEAMAKFFISEVDQGVKDLELFTRLLLTELEEGQQIELTVKGFASPLAKSDYNVKLTSRRISSLINYLNTYERGAIQPYLDHTAENSGKLDIVQIPFGEYVADNFVSDNPNDKNNAIYSIAAARERKIEIVSVQRPQSDSLKANLVFETEIINLGLLEPSDSLAFSFKASLDGRVELKIDSVLYDADIIHNFEIINPSKSDAKLEVSGILYPGNRSGKQNVEIVIFGNLGDGRKTLNITFEIE